MEERSRGSSMDMGGGPPPPNGLLSSTHHLSGDGAMHPQTTRWNLPRTGIGIQIAFQKMEVLEEEERKKGNKDFDPSLLLQTNIKSPLLSRFGKQKSKEDPLPTVWEEHDKIFTNPYLLRIQAFGPRPNTNQLEAIFGRNVEILITTRVILVAFPTESERDHWIKETPLVGGRRCTTSKVQYIPGNSSSAASGCRLHVNNYGDATERELSSSIQSLASSASVEGFNKTFCYLKFPSKEDRQIFMQTWDKQGWKLSNGYNPTISFPEEETPFQLFVFNLHPEDTQNELYRAFFKLVRSALVEVKMPTFPSGKNMGWAILRLLSKEAADCILQLNEEGGAFLTGRTRILFDIAKSPLVREIERGMKPWSSNSTLSPQKPIPSTRDFPDLPRKANTHPTTSKNLNPPLGAWSQRPSFMDNSSPHLNSESTLKQQSHNTNPQGKDSSVMMIQLLSKLMESLEVLSERLSTQITLFQSFFDQHSFRGRSSRRSLSKGSLHRSKSKSRRRRRSSPKAASESLQKAREQERSTRQEKDESILEEHGERGAEEMDHDGTAQEEEDGSEDEESPTTQAKEHNFTPYKQALQSTSVDSMENFPQQKVAMSQTQVALPQRTPQKKRVKRKAEMVESTPEEALVLHKSAQSSTISTPVTHTEHSEDSDAERRIKPRESNSLVTSVTPTTISQQELQNQQIIADQNQTLRFLCGNNARWPKSLSVIPSEDREQKIEQRTSHLRKMSLEVLQKEFSSLKELHNAAKAHARSLTFVPDSDADAPPQRKLRSRYTEINSQPVRQSSRPHRVPTHYHS